MRFSIKNYILAVSQVLQNNQQWRNDYNSRTTTHENQEAESRARHEGEICAMEDLLKVLPGLKTKLDVQEVLFAEIANIKTRNPSFTTNTGWAQVDGRGIEKNKEYGKWSRMQLLVDVDSMVRFYTPPKSSTP